MFSSVLEAIGNTPLLRLEKLGRGMPGRVLLKLENRNPGGSIKDRVAFHVIDKTMEWVYRYTGGLVWYTKLLGKAMLERAKAAGRTVVYPTDVYDAFTSICTDSNCQQFYEGCGDDEHLVLQTLARLSPRYRSVVSKESLRTALGGGLSESKLTSALNRLTELRLIEGKAERYSFRKEIYRRYFRSKLAISDGSVGDIMEKTVSVTSGAPFGGFARKR